MSRCLEDPCLIPRAPIIPLNWLVNISLDDEILSKGQELREDQRDLLDLLDLLDQLGRGVQQVQEDHQHLRGLVGQQVQEDHRHLQDLQGQLHLLLQLSQGGLEVLEDLVEVVEFQQGLEDL